MLTELLEGEPLFSKGKVYTNDEMYTVVKKSFLILRMLKKHKLVLRCVYPSNIIYDKDAKATNRRQVKLTNLNYACYQLFQCTPLKELKYAHYLAPEILCNKRVAFFLPVADIFTFGLMIFEIAARLDFESVYSKDMHANLIANRGLIIRSNDRLNPKSSCNIISVLFIDENASRGPRRKN